MFSVSLRSLILHMHLILHIQCAYKKLEAGDCWAFSFTTIYELLQPVMDFGRFGQTAST